MAFRSPTGGKFVGMPIHLPALGEVQLTHILTKNSETHLYYTDHPGVVVKMYDLSCGKPDEISFPPYASFSLELANFEDVINLEALAPLVPAYYGANIDYEGKYAYIAMEYLDGQDIKSWCEHASAAGYQEDWLAEFRQALYEALSIMRLFHRHGIILVDFKPDNVIRMPDREIRFVDLGALFTPRYSEATQKYAYSATPDHSEVLIDACNVQTGMPPTEASDMFSAGVALFELATGNSRLLIEDGAADDMLRNAQIYLFRDSQIRDVWRVYPHLKDSLPLLEEQLRERRILFADLWPLLKGFVSFRVPDWDALPLEQQDQIILATGTTFIMEQLPPPLQWLTEPIAMATTLRSLRLKSVEELMKLIEIAAPLEAIEDIKAHNCFIQYLADMERTVKFADRLNAWEVKLDQQTGQWAVAAHVAATQLPEEAAFTFLKEVRRDEQGHGFYHIVGDLEADDFQEQKLTLRHLQHNHFAWLGASPLLGRAGPTIRSRREHDA